MQTLKLTAGPEPTEAEIQSALIRRLLASGWIVLRVNGGGFKDATGRFVRCYTVAGIDQCEGFPDVVAFRSDCWGNVEARLFEVKRRGGQCNAAQIRFASYANNAAGVAVEIVEGFEGLNRLNF